jgi:hypothetical protein
MVRDAEKKRDREEKRKVETREHLEERSREREERRRSKGKEVVTVINDRGGSPSASKEAPAPSETKQGGLEPGARKPTREERRAKREETRRMIEEVQRQIELEKKRLAELDAGKQPFVEERSEPGPSSSKNDVVDPFQYQVATDAFPTPALGSPKRSITPVIHTVEREPDWAREVPSRLGEREERLSRRCSFEREIQEAQAAAGETNGATASAGDGETPAAIVVPGEDRARSRSREPPRGRDPEPVRDVVQDEANRHYREKRMAERVAEEEIRSRTPSPSRSVIDKYEDNEDPVGRIVTPPEMKRPPTKSKFDGPNADVRIDNVITPQEVSRFHPPPPSARGLGPVMMPIFKSRDPSCERERPLLNLVLPTPRTSPSLEKMKARQVAAQAVDDPISEDEKKKEERKPKTITNYRGQTVEVPDDYDTGRVVEKESRESSQERPAIKLRFSSRKKKSAWGSLIAAAVVGAAGKTKGQGLGQGEKAVETQGSAGAAEADKDKSRGAEPASEPKSEPAPIPEAQPTIEAVREASRDVAPEPEPVSTETAPESQPSPTRSVSQAPSTPPRWSRVPFEFDESPPQIGPKPISPQAPKTGGTYGDDIDFAATLAVGLQSAGFNPDMVVNDPTYRKRDSPRGSNELTYAPPSSETVTDLGLESANRGAEENAVRKKPEVAPKPEDVEFSREPSVLDADDEWSMKSSTKSPRSKRDSSYDTATYSAPSSEVSFGSSGSKKNKRNRRKSTKDSYDIPEQDEPPDRPGESFQWIDREVSSVVSDPSGKLNGGHHGTAPVVSHPTNGNSEHHERSTTQNGDEKGSFLGNAGTFGAGAGLAGAVVAIAAQLSRPNATQDLVKEEDEQGMFGRKRSVSYSSQTVDPEIIQREIKPAIDPQFGDLLPLPPSEPGSPNLNHLNKEDDVFPSLPDSEEDTPSPQQTRPRRGTISHTHTRWRSAVEPPKTPSRTAVPVQFRMGRGSVPSSPAFRFSPVHSPVASTHFETGGHSPKRNRSARPMSWDSSRDFKPLYLLEKTASSSAHGTPADAKQQDEYPELPPSEPPSRESPGPEFAQREDDVDYLSVGLRVAAGIGASMGLLEALQIDTSSRGLDLGAGEVKFGEPLGSGETTPRAAASPTSRGFDALTEKSDEAAYDALDEWQVVEELDALPPLPESPVESPVLAPSLPVVAAEPQPIFEDSGALPALPDSLPTSPLVMGLPLASRQLPSVEDLEQLPALPKSRPSSPVREARPSAPSPSLLAEFAPEQLPSLPDSRPESPTLETQPSAPNLPLLAVSEPREFPPLPESRPESPTLEVLPAVSSLPLFASFEPEQLPALPESRPDSPVLEVRRFAPSPPLVASSEPAELPPLPESRPDSPALEALPVASSLPLFASFEPEQLPALPESRPSSPTLEVLPSVTSPPLLASFDPEQLPALPESRPPSSTLNALPSTSGRSLPAGIETEELPQLPESRADSPLLAPLSPAATTPSPAKDLEDLPALPESRPASLVLGRFSSHSFPLDNRLT